MDISLQPKILRVLEEKKVDIIGGGSENIDIRIIASTNQSPEKLVEEGKMRKDLFYRLNVIRIDLPPLRDRKDEIEPLMRYFISNSYPDKKFKIEPEVFEVFKRYPWPGNVRELKNLCERVALLTEGDVIKIDDIPSYILSHYPQNISTDYENMSLHEIEKEIIEKALEKNNYNQSATAKYLGIPRHVLLYRMEKYGIKKNNKI